MQQSANTAFFCNNHSGMTLPELLVAMVIMALGLLGTLSLQTTSLRSNLGALHRSQAILLAGELAEKMRANPPGVMAGSYDETASRSYLPVNCAEASCSPTELAQYDLAVWNESLTDSLPDGKGIVCTDATPDDGSYDAPGCDANTALHAIKIFWDEDGDGIGERNHVLAVSLHTGD